MGKTSCIKLVLSEDFFKKEVAAFMSVSAMIVDDTDVPLEMVTALEIGNEKLMISIFVKSL